MNNLTPFQKWLLMMCRKGFGVSAAPSDITSRQRLEADEMVRAGILRRSKNHSTDKTGCYVLATDDPKLTTAGADLGK